MRTLALAFVAACGAPSPVIEYVELHPSAASVADAGVSDAGADVAPDVADAPPDAPRITGWTCTEIAIDGGVECTCHVADIGIATPDTCLQNAAWSCMKAFDGSSCTCFTGPEQLALLSTVTGASRTYACP